MATSHRKRHPHVPTRIDNDNEQTDKGVLICKPDKRWIEQSWDDWSVVPNGNILLRRGKLFTLDGTTELYRGYYDDWRPHYDYKLMLRIGNHFFTPLNRRMYYQGPWDDWRPHPDGVVIRRGNRFLLNGKDDGELYRGSWDEWDVQPYTGKIYTRCGCQFFSNGKEIFAGAFDGWDVSRRGLVIRYYDQFFQDGKQLIYSGQYDGWRAHTRGIVIRRRSEWRVYT